ncbi:hypothetical protein GOBAR_AA22022 [Gossypium barbadense]|uniref:Uncharacterized protein n=1 Tax=Gossypium barbadense TaxID=3634 RepID=A0A2P5X5N2_GOSBA|nr:hypothetical protein GOBAR_AA22022 [Gossypium barbadense]
MLSSRGKKSAVPASKKRNGASSSVGPTAEIRRCIDWAAVEQVQMADAIQALLTTDPWEMFFRIIEPTYLELTMELCSMFHLQILMTRYDNPGTVQFCLGGLIRQLSSQSPHTCLSLEVLAHVGPSTPSYNPGRSKASVLTPSLSYLDVILAYTITRRRENNGVINTHDVYFLLARHFGLLNTATQESSLTLIGQMSPQGISSMLSMRMIERHQGTYPSQYRLTQSIEEEAYEDIPDDVPPQHEDPPTQPPPPSRPVHAAASYADISERLTRFEHQCFQRFDNIDATLQQICQYLHISLLVPPREPSSDEDV